MPTAAPIAAPTATLMANFPSSYFTRLTIFYLFFTRLLSFYISFRFNFRF